MMQSNYIEFNKKREIGEVITDTFKFLRKNIKPLFSVLLKTLLIPYILLVVAVVFYSITTSELTNTLYILDNIRGNLSGIIISALALLATGSIYSGLLYGSVTEYIKEYKTTNGQPTIDIILKHVKEKTGSYISLAFLNILYVFGVAFLLMIIGGFLIGGFGTVFGVFFILGALIYTIYLYARYTVIFPSFAHNKETVFQSFVTSSKLIKEEWWNTFLTLFLLGLITFAISFVFQLPGSIYSIAKEFTNSGEYLLTDPSVDWILVTFQTLASAISYILYIILAVAVNFIFSNLNERKNQTGSLDRINSIGRSDEE